MFPNFCYDSIFATSGQASAEQTSQEVKKEVEQHLKEKERIERSLPSSIMIGPFNVRVEAVRQALCNKRKALANAMLQRLTLKLRKKIDDVSHLISAQKTQLFQNMYTVSVSSVGYRGSTFNSICLFNFLLLWMVLSCVCRRVKSVTLWAESYVRTPTPLKSWLKRGTGWNKSRDSSRVTRYRDGIVKWIFLAFIFQWRYVLSVTLIFFPICPQQEIISKILSDYELTEELCYCLPDEDANKKYNHHVNQEKIWYEHLNNMF